MDRNSIFRLKDKHKFIKASGNADKQGGREHRTENLICLQSLVNIFSHS